MRGLIFLWVSFLSSVFDPSSFPLREVAASHHTRALRRSGAPSPVPRGAMAGPFPTSTVYTHQFWQPVTCAFYLSSLVLLSALVTRRTPAWGTWKAAGPAKWALLTVLVYS